MRFKLNTLQAALLLCLTPALSYAESAETTLSPVLVTADLRETAEQDLPVSVDIKSSADLQDQGALHFDDVLLKTPNVNFSGQSSHARHIQIRGIGERDEYTGAPNSSVGFAVDDIDFSGIGMTGNLFDAKQVEVLRGPQNTRYGQSAIAGLINIKTNDPTATEESMLETSLGQDNLKELGLMTSGPFNASENSPQYRISLFKHLSDGFRTNTTLNSNDTNGRDELNLRAKFRFTPNKDTQVDLSLIHADLNNGYDVWSRDNSFTTLSNQPGRDEQLSNAASLKVTWAGNPDYELTSKTSLANSNMVYSYDGDWIADPAKTVGSYHNAQHRKNYSQEFRWASTNNSKIFNGTTDWLIGTYLSNKDESNDRTELYNYTTASDIYNTTAKSDFQHSKVALYTQLDQALSDRTTINYSLRVEHNQKTFDLATHKTGFDTSYGGGAFDYTLTDAYQPSETLWGGSIHYNYKYNASHTAFAGVTRGYKSSGFNAALGGTANVHYDAETLMNYEIGLNSTHSKYNLTTSTTFFYMDRSKPQFDGYSYEPGGAEWVFFTENLDAAANYGLETEFNWQANSAWNIYGTLGLLRTEVVGTPVNSSFTMSGRDQAHAPSYQFNLGAKYRAATGFYAQADVTGMNSFNFDNTHNFTSDPYRIVNARLGYETEAYEVYLWGKNIADEVYSTRGFEFDHWDGDGTQQYTRLGDPRQVGLTARVYF